MQENASRPPGRIEVAWLIVGTALGAAIGIIATWALLSGNLEHLGSWLESIQNLILAAVIGFGAAVVLGVPLGYWILRRFIGITRASLGEVVVDIATASEAAIQHDVAKAVAHVGKALQKAVVWYAPVVARRFVVQTSLGLIIAFGGLVGTALLLRQNILLSAQNAKIDLQTITAEAQRRGYLSQELFSIIGIVTNDETIKMELENSGALWRNVERGLTSRIVVFSRAATPYWLVELPLLLENGTVIREPRRSERARSPERGQLLIGLVNARVSITHLSRVGATFADADLRGADLGNGSFEAGGQGDGINLGGIDLQGADLSSALLIGAFLQEARLQSADLQNANLTGATLQGANLEFANLTNSILTEIQMDDQTNLENAIVDIVRFESDVPLMLPESVRALWRKYQDGYDVRLRRNQ